MTSPRIIVAGATTAITRRTTMRKAFLAPWHPMVQEIVLYALADAQRRTDVEVHHAVVMLNHIHLTVTPRRDNLPEFTRRFHHDVSCAVNVLLAREKYDAPREIFDGRSAHYMRLLDSAAQAAHLVYERNNWVAAGLVSRPEHMPGRSLSFDTWRTGHIDVGRPSVFFSEDRPESIRLLVTPPPLLLEEHGGDLERLIYQMSLLSEEATRAILAARARPPLGVRKVKRLHPWNEPRSLRETGGRMVPSFRVGARRRGVHLEEMAAALETRGFRREYKEALAVRRTGDLAKRFPYGTYQMRVLHGARVESAPHDGALVTRPGSLAPSMRTKSRLARSVRPSSLESVRTALVEEASDLCDELCVSLDEQNPLHVGAPTDMKQAHALSVHTRHRFATDRDAALACARRIVVLRDRRMGRRSAAARRGGDPPV